MEDHCKQCKKSCGTHSSILAERSTCPSSRQLKGKKKKKSREVKPWGGEGQDTRRKGTKSESKAWSEVWSVGLDSGQQLGRVEQGRGETNKQVSHKLLPQGNDANTHT